MHVHGAGIGGVVERVGHTHAEKSATKMGEGIRAAMRILARRTSLRAPLRIGISARGGETDATGSPCAKAGGRGVVEAEVHFGPPHGKNTLKAGSLSDQKKITKWTSVRHFFFLNGEGH